MARGDGGVCQISWSLLLLLAATGIKGISRNGGLVVISPPMELQEEGDVFRISAKSEPVVARAGEAVDLTCRTTKEWRLCGWLQPEAEEWCDRLSSSKYDSACDSNDRVRYKRPSLPSNPNAAAFTGPTHCAITILDLAVEDSGTWTCNVKEELRSDVEFYEEIEVAVASPYSVSLEPSDPAVVIVGAGGGGAGGQPDNTSVESFNESTNSIVCSAVGAGAVDPVLEWRLDGKRLDAASGVGIRNWREEGEEEQEGGQKVFHSALTLLDESGLNAALFDSDSDDDDVQSVREVSCVSRQLYPNGSAIFETMARTSVTVVAALGPEALTGGKREIDEASMNGVGGLVFSVLFSLVVIVAIVFLCWAHKAKKFCYEPVRNPRLQQRNAVPRSTSFVDRGRREEESPVVVEVSIEGEPDGEAQDGVRRDMSTSSDGDGGVPVVTDIVPEEEMRSLVTGDENRQNSEAQNPNESPLYADVRHMDDDEDGDPEPPPSAPPISPEEETTQNNPFSFSSTPNATMRQASHERYKEMILAAPPTTPPTATGGGGIRIPIYRDFSVPAPLGLTEGLTAPRIQRRNDYVSLNSRPASGSRPVSSTSEGVLPVHPPPPPLEQQTQQNASRPISTLASTGVEPSSATASVTMHTDNSAGEDNAEVAVGRDHRLMTDSNGAPLSFGETSL